jgi:hypothetical protein
VTSTASTTKFSGRWLDHRDHHLYLDGNAKVACDGTYEDPAPNSLSLVHGQDCPGSTETCRAGCYVHGLKDALPDLFARYQDNSRTMRQILDDDALSIEWAAALATWINRRARGGFRWHVSGDVIGLDHAEWIRNVCRLTPGVTHWIYTRSFWAIDSLIEAPNLVVNVSADRDNFVEAKSEAEFHRLRLCYLNTGELTPDLPDGSVIFPDYQLRGRDMEKPTEHPWWQGLTQRERRMVCPVDFFGKSRSIRCAVCRRCLRHPTERSAR